MANTPFNVLVLASGSPLGQSIVKALKNSRLPLQIHVADVSDLAAGFYLPEVFPIILPPVKDPTYLNQLNNYIKKHNICAIFPVIAIEHEFFAINATNFKEAKVAILSCSSDVYTLCNDKYKSMIHLRNLGLSAPDTTLCETDEEVESFLMRNKFPIFIKPRSGASSTDLFKIQSKNQLFGVLNAFPRGHFIAQTFLDDSRDYTAGVYVSRNRALQSTLLIERELKFGLSYRGIIFENEDLSKYCLKVAQAIASHYTINVQFKIINGQPFAYEINPRLSSTTSVRAHFGFNEPDMMLHEALGLLDGYVINKRSGRFTRYWQEHYLENI
ncbi:ATP-grasp domain-containing protein [Polynucleobacter paneuropaeus]|nr:ATP-grasp domain-containing protein [Polynucleobacter paneuropaeus]